VSGPTLWLVLLGSLAALPLLFLLTFLIWASLRYGWAIDRIFEERPVFLPLRVEPGDLGEPVSFTTADGLRLEGSYLKHRAGSRVGVLVFCHEYLSDRWSYAPYLDHLRDAGYDVFTFDFRNHGSSDRQPDYAPLQWATDHEVRDLRAALGYLRSRPDRDAAGFGLFGVSRGGGTALVAAASARDVWGVVSDGAFPTRGTMTYYITRWAEIYVQSQFLLTFVPTWIYEIMGWMSRRRSARRLNCRFPALERAARKLAPRPWLMIHGAKDTYIGPDIARRFLDCARQPKEMWLVPEAKHNRCRESEPEAYAERLREFLARYAPRRPLVPAADPAAATAEEVNLPSEPNPTRAGSMRLSNVPAAPLGQAAAV
jgi:pimeloyl-ACP methyl ester carboxylesterase